MVHRRSLLVPRPVDSDGSSTANENETPRHKPVEARQVRLGPALAGGARRTRRFQSVGVLALLFTVAACGAPDVEPQAPPAAGPTTAPSVAPAPAKLAGKGVQETLHGVVVEDPYRGLEDEKSAETAQFVARQMTKTTAYFEGIKGKKELEAEIASLVQVGNVAAPAVRGTGKERRYFHTKRTGAQRQPTLYVREGVRGTDRPLLDVATLSADATVSLDWWYPSQDGTLLAWGRSEGGSEESTLVVRDVKTGRDLPDRIPRTRYSSVAWLPSGKAFYYTRYPTPGTVAPGDERYHVRVYRHELGADPESDPLVFGEDRDKTDMPQVSISPNGRWLVVRVHQGWAKSEVYLKDLSTLPKAAPKAGKEGDAKKAAANKEPGAFVPVAVKADSIFNPIVRDDRLYIHTNDGAPRYRLFAVDYAKPERAHWKELVAEGADVLTDVAVTEGALVLGTLHDAASRVAVATPDGKPLMDVALPGLGTAHVTAPVRGGEAFVEFVSFVTPPRVLRVDLASAGKKAPPAPPPAGVVTRSVQSPAIWDSVGGDLAVEGITVTQLSATSKDGTRVPMFVVAAGDLSKGSAGPRPTLLWGYGGFNVNQTPAFSSRALVMAKRGGVFVSAVLRGGGEMGEAWHRAGMLEKKQNVFDDFIAYEEELVKRGITSSAKLAIGGGSNGGLLTATAVVQRPELFRAALSLVPLTDMVRYTRFQLARLWIPEYGDPDKAEHFRFLQAYSPYHHVAPGTRYPSVLVATAESDTRVDPMHARKFAARLEEAQAAKANPVLLRVEAKAGHGAGKPTTKVIAQLADELSFVLHELGAM
ncbi:MAG: S9 family peptidase [Myxococcales bacterium]|nr:S9 family peptidase [Myxococcales bacterium]